MKEWPDSIALALHLRLTNGKSDSVREMRTDLLCRDHNLPMPEPQYEICHPHGGLSRVASTSPGPR